MKKKKKRERLFFFGGVRAGPSDNGVSTFRKGSEWDGYVCGLDRLGKKRLLRQKHVNLKKSLQLSSFKFSSAFFVHEPQKRGWLSHRRGVELAKMHARKATPRAVLAWVDDGVGGQPKLDVIFFFLLSGFFFLQGEMRLSCFFLPSSKAGLVYRCGYIIHTYVQRMRNARADIQHRGQHRTASCSTLQGLSGVKQPGPSIRGQASYPIQSSSCIDHAYPKWKMELNSVTTHDPT